MFSYMWNLMLKWLDCKYSPYFLLLEVLWGGAVTAAQSLNHTADNWTDINDLVTSTQHSSSHLWLKLHYSHIFLNHESQKLQQQLHTHTILIWVKMKEILRHFYKWFDKDNKEPYRLCRKKRWRKVEFAGFTATAKQQECLYDSCGSLTHGIQSEEKNKDSKEKKNRAGEGDYHWAL